MKLCYTIYMNVHTIRIWYNSYILIFYNTSKFKIKLQCDIIKILNIMLDKN